jgi:competence protein ComEA
VEQSTRLAWILGILTVVAGLWGLWPHLAPRALGIPQVVRQNFTEPTAVTFKSSQNNSTNNSSATPNATATPGSSVQNFLPDKVNLNTATLEQIVALPSVGPTMAQRIVDGRPYRSISDLDKVKGIGPKLLEKLAPVVTF